MHSNINMTSMVKAGAVLLELTGIIAVGLGTTYREVCRCTPWLTASVSYEPGGCHTMALSSYYVLQEQSSGTGKGNLGIANML